MPSDLIAPDWPAPAGVFALQTTRLGGVSQGSYASLNLAAHVDDRIEAVNANRVRLQAHLPAPPLWLDQVHGTRVVDAGAASTGVSADAAIARSSNTVCAVMTADCLPILLCDRAATVVGAVHAGWRSLAAGIVEQTVAAMACPGECLLAWLGPAIGPDAFEVGGEVRAAFVGHDVRADAAFRVKPDGKYLADLYALARQRLADVGVFAVYGGNFCTLADSERFFSFRRDGATGRMATLVALV